MICADGKAARPTPARSAGKTTGKRPPYLPAAVCHVPHFTAGALRGKSLPAKSKQPGACTSVRSRLFVFCFFGSGLRLRPAAGAG